ncbi:MAG: UDP-2,3-diacylglucosamine diphosphatase [Bacteroidota bacterium]
MNPERSHIYLASDMHFGSPNEAASLVRERHFVAWLDSIKPTAKELYLVGDLFDFWFEYRQVVPRGYVRFLGKLAEFVDDGIPVHYFPGNHDLWFGNYLQDQVGAIYHPEPLVTELFGRKFYLAHGDGLGPGDHGYKLMKRVFTNPLCKWLFRILHPDLGIGLAYFLSRKSRNYTQMEGQHYFGEKEWLRTHSKEVLQSQPDITAFIYGHRHLAIQEQIAENAEMVYLGDWITLFSYLEVTEEGNELKFLPRKEKITTELSRS